MVMRLRVCGVRSRAVEHHDAAALRGESGLRVALFNSLKSCVVAFEDKSAYRINPCGYSTVRGLIFWFRRVRSLVKFVARLLMKHMK